MSARCKPRHVAPQEVETRAGDLHTPREVDQPHLFGDLPVRPHGKIELFRRTPGARDHVAGLIRAVRNDGIRQVRHFEQERVELIVHFVDPGVQSLDLIPKITHGGDALVTFRAGLETANLL